MQGGDNAADYVSRAKGKLSEWAAKRADADRDCRFDRCTASELIGIAGTDADLSGPKLTPGNLYALHGA